MLWRERVLSTSVSSNKTRDCTHKMSDKVRMSIPDRDMRALIQIKSVI